MLKKLLTDRLIKIKNRKKNPYNNYEMICYDFKICITQLNIQLLTNIRIKIFIVF